MAALSSLEGLKIIKAQEMARIEKMAYLSGASELAFMEKAGQGVAHAVQDFIALHALAKTVTLFVGKGNNGGDAYAAGACLIEWGFKTVAVHLYAPDECTPLCQTMHDRFRALGGSIQYVRHGEMPHLGTEGVIVDGLTGTGFHGKAEGILAQAIDVINASLLPVIAIDVPSGVNGNTGEVATIAVQATETVFLELPKIGFFLKKGWDHVGRLRCAPFGLEDRYCKEAEPLAYLLNEECIAEHLPQIQRTRHKYQAGYVLAVAGSPGMPGAAILSCTAALRSGSGIVRLFHPRGMGAELASAPWELIRQEWDGKDLDLVLAECARAKVLLVGPGIGKTKEAGKVFFRLLGAIDLPMVVDADGLFFLATKSSWKLPKGSVLTPHCGEMNRLLGLADGKGLCWDLCQGYVEQHSVTLVLKGAPTVIFHPGTHPLVITRGDPGMATAGSGDVLTGMVAALLAQGLDARCAAVLGAYLHGLSGEIAAEALTSYCVTASDLIDFLPDAFLEAMR